MRTALGREIRRAFTAREGWLLCDADYSQIELRLLAHLSGDEGMIEAFRAGQDIHARTAAEVYGVPLNEVTPAMRSAAKAVNFGIVYGISDFGLARNVGVSRREAGAFIERYFSRYPAVRRFMDDAVAKGKLLGYSTTMFGRRRPLPELSSSNYNTRSFGERAAMNTPVQGTAADIIKLAMVRVHERLAELGLSRAADPAGARRIDRRDAPRRAGCGFPGAQDVHGGRGAAVRSACRRCARGQDLV